MVTTAIIDVERPTWISGHRTTVAALHCKWHQALQQALSVAASSNPILGAVRFVTVL
jgi:hypothetical protein